MSIRPDPAAASVKLSGTPVYKGVIVATTTVNNHTTASAFLNTGAGLGGKLLLLQPSAICYINFGTTNAVTATTTNGVKLAADDRVIVAVEDLYGWLACVSDSGTTNLRVWELV